MKTPYIVVVLRFNSVLQIQRNLPINSLTTYNNRKHVNSRATALGLSVFCIVLTTQYSVLTMRDARLEADLEHVVLFRRERELAFRHVILLVQNVTFRIEHLQQNPTIVNPKKSNKYSGNYMHGKTNIATLKKLFLHSKNTNLNVSVFYQKY